MTTQQATLKFSRTHKPTDSIFISVFNVSHDYCFSDDQKDYSYNTRLKVAKALIEKWNRQQPEIWYYRIKS